MVLPAEVFDVTDLLMVFYESTNGIPGKSH